MSETFDPGDIPAAGRDPETFDAESRSTFKVTRNAKGNIQFEIKVVAASHEKADVRQAFNEAVYLAETMITKYPFTVSR